jgi:release factor glutamine methyltransferase
MPELALSLRVLIAEGAERLRQAQIPEPRRQALRIWAELNPAGSAETMVVGELEVSCVSTARFQRAIERRALGEPLPHITGWAGFRHLNLRSDSRALIPRPETEGLVELLLQRVRSGRVADIGTGSGCIALSLALEGDFSEVVGVDRSSDALMLARQNRELVGARVDLVQGDLCEPLCAGAFDALVSNPPYLTVAEYGALEGAVREWEPSFALVSGQDGLDATARLLEGGHAVLRPGGWLALEVDCSRAVRSAERAVSLGWEDVAIHMDLFGRERYLLARRSNTR